MAHPDLLIAGTTYQAVPSIVIPKSWNGNAEFFDMGEDMSFLGGDVVKLLDIAPVTTALSATDFDTWSPSTTATTIVATSTATTFTADMANYEYFLVWDCMCPIITDSSATKKALPLLTAAYLVQEIHRRPGSWDAICSNSFTTNTCANVYSSNFIRYYGTTTNKVTYTWGASYAIYFAPAAATFSNATADDPTVTIKMPTVSARCSTTYMSTTNAGLIDKTNTIITRSGHLYRTRTKGFLRGVYENTARIINSQSIVT